MKECCQPGRGQNKVNMELYTVDQNKVNIKFYTVVSKFKKKKKKKKRNIQAFFS